MDLISKKALLSILIVAFLGGGCTAHLSATNFDMASLFGYTMPSAGMDDDLDGINPCQASIFDDEDFFDYNGPVAKKVQPLVKSLDTTVPAITEVGRFKDACDKVVSSICATGPVQFIKTGANLYPKTVKVVVAAALIGTTYAVVNSQYGKKVRAQIAESEIFKKTQKFVTSKREALAGAVAIVADNFLPSA